MKLDQEKVFEIFKLLLQRNATAPVDALVDEAKKAAHRLGYSTETDEETQARLRVEFDDFVEDLTVRTRNCLKTADIDTLDKLCSHSEHDLIKIPSMGRKSIHELKEHLVVRGLRLRSA